jgi:chemotaxis protein MotB
MSNEDRPEMIFVRKRHGDGEEDHHGGVWKLAFADFMTAMMAFFLVMWLINSTSKETKAAIVQYFNPVQLLDSKPAKKGLRDPKDSGQGASMQQTQESKEAAESGQSQGLGKSDEASLRADPLKTLDVIAKRDLPAALPATAATDAPQDPFDRMDDPPAAENGVETEASKPTNPGKLPATAQPAAKNNSVKSDSGGALADVIAAAIKSEARGISAAPKSDVKKIDDGLLISLTDDARFSMFDVGSIKPKPQLVRILQKIGSALAKQPGSVEIGGHTDARQYKSATYDNWRLSSDRANMVYYMLVRGGLAPARVTRISGYADRRLKTPEAPLAPINRRIEILIRGDRG